jgi:hypothetical protein
LGTPFCVAWIAEERWLDALDAALASKVAMTSFFVIFSPPCDPAMTSAL